MGKTERTNDGLRMLFLQGRVFVMLVLALLFSALPLVLGFLIDKSSVPLSIFTAWYALWPAIVIFLLGLWLNRKQPHWLRILAQTWVGLSLWFWLQYVFAVLTGVHLIFRLLALPTVLAGGSDAFLVGGLVFLIGGIVFWFIATRVPVPQSKPAASRIALALLVILALALPAFVVFTTQLSGASTPSAPIPTQDQVFGYISDVYNLGERRPGSAADQKAITYLEAKLREFGLTDVRTEKSSFDYWEPVRWSLTIQASNPGTWEVEAFYVPYSGPTKPEGITAEVVDLGNISTPKWQDVTGKIVLVDIPATDISWDQLKLFSFIAYDPTQSTKGWHHPYPIGWGGKYVTFYKEVESRHPAGIIGILRDYPDMGKFTYYCPYDGEMRTIPSMYILGTAGDQLKAEVANGKVTAKMVLDAKVSSKGGESANVYAVLPGKSASTLLIHSHHDAPWRSGVEDSSGVGMVLGLARYYAQVPLAQRERTLIFLFTGGHMVGGPTNADFIAKHKNDLLARTLFDIAIEHVADDYNPPNPATGKAEPRGVFVTENPVLIGHYAAAIAKTNSQRTLIFPTGTPLGVPTDAGYYFRSGIPIVSLISGPSWLFDDDDTLDRVAKSELEPLTRLYVDFIARLNATPDWLLQFNLGWAAVGLLALVFTPLAAAFFAWRRVRSG